MNWKNIPDTVHVMFMFFLICGGFYLWLSGCAVQEPPKVASYVDNYAITAAICEVTEDEVTLQGWISTACEYLNAQETVLGYVVNENSILIRFTDVESFAVVCFPCRWE